MFDHYKGLLCSCVCGALLRFPTSVNMLLPVQDIRHMQDTVLVVLAMFFMHV